MLIENFKISNKNITYNLAEFVKEHIQPTAVPVEKQKEKGISAAEIAVLAVGLWLAATGIPTIIYNVWWLEREGRGESHDVEEANTHDKKSRPFLLEIAPKKSTRSRQTVSDFTTISEEEEPLNSIASSDTRAIEAALPLLDHNSKVFSLGKKEQYTSQEIQRQLQPEKGNSSPSSSLLLSSNLKKALSLNNITGLSWPKLN